MGHRTGQKQRRSMLPSEVLPLPQQFTHTTIFRQLEKNKPQGYVS